MTEKPKDNITGKHKGGRPKKAIKQSESLVVKMTATEKLIISEKARKAGLTQSEWFRQSAKNAEVIQRLLPSDISHLNVLAVLANNLNQLTRLAHIKGITSLAEQCSSLIDAISLVINKLFADDRKTDKL
jgi:hypothetical protein